MTKIRSPICVLVGHVDHGKTTILDQIRGTAVAAAEAGNITQCISSTCVPLDVVKKICGDLLRALKLKFTIPGLLFLDSPGHAAFTNLRKRGGNLADIAVLVIDINEGVKEQTLECIDILKQYKTPFIIALNKIDLISGWRTEKESLLKNIEKQADSVKQLLDKRLYELVGKLSGLNFNAERYDRVDDYTKQIAIVPVSAKSGEGIAELLMVLSGLAQRYLEKNLQIEVKGPAKGTILEVKEEEGIGIGLDTIIYDGSLKQNDMIVIGGLDKAIVTKVRALFEPAQLTELKKSRFMPVKEVHAATGVRISAPNVDDVVAGMPLRVADKKNLDQIKEEIQKEVEEVLIETEKEGIIVKADSLGSLEALIGLLKEKDIKIKRASIGNITKKDIAEADSEKDVLNKIVLGFNVKALQSKNVKVITHDIIYKIIEDFEKWVKDEQLRLEKKELEGLVKPCKVQILKGCVFRQSNPAVVGVVVLNGVLENNIPLMKEDGNKVALIKSMQLDKKNVERAEKGKEVAISLPGVVVGRHINEEDIFYSDMPEDDFRRFKKLKRYLNGEEIEILKEIASIKRKKESMWGI